MKIKDIFIKNFAGVSEFSCSLSNGINYIVGSNGSGKSTAGVSAIWACLKGIGERGDVWKGKRFRFIGPSSDTAEIEITVADDRGEYKICREISEGGNKLLITASDGRTLDQDWINSFFNEFMISPIEFSRLDPRQQANMLGIDTSSFDREIADIKQESTLLRAKVKSFGDVQIPEEAPSEVDMASLLEERDRILAFNKEQDDVARAIADTKTKKLELQAEERRLMEKLESVRSGISYCDSQLEHAPRVEEKIPLGDIDSKIASATSDQARYMEYQQLLKKVEGLDAAKSELSDSQERLKSKISERADYMASLELPFSNLGIDESGGLLMEGNPLSRPYLSTGELIKVCTLLMASTNPGWKYVYLEDFDLLDDKKAGEVLEFLSERGFQVLAERVSKSPSDGVVVLQDEN